MSLFEETIINGSIQGVVFVGLVFLLYKLVKSHNRIDLKAIIKKHFDNGAEK